MSHQICKIFPNYFYTSHRLLLVILSKALPYFECCLSVISCFLVLSNLVLAWSSRSTMVSVPNVVLNFGWLWRGLYHAKLALRLKLSVWICCWLPYLFFFTVRLGWICERLRADSFNFLSDRPCLLCNLKR